MLAAGLRPVSIHSALSTVSGLEIRYPPDAAPPVLRRVSIVSGQDHWPRIEEEAMHPAMLKALAAEHIRDMRVTAAKARRVSAAREARRGTAAPAARRAECGRQAARLSDA
jgi:hypothetical protein